MIATAIEDKIPIPIVQKTAAICKPPWRVFDLSYPNHLLVLLETQVLTEDGTSVLKGLIAARMAE